MTSIADFAESLILDEIKNVKEGKALPPSLSVSENKLAPAGKDIRNIDVPDSFMQEVLGEDYKSPPKPQLKEEVEEIQTELEPDDSEPRMISEEKADRIITLLTDVKKMLSEMGMATFTGTSTGNIGNNFAGPSEVSPPRRSQRRKKKSRKSRKSIFKEAYYARIKR